MILRRTIGPEDSGRVLRDYLRRELRVSARLLKRLKSNSLISINGGIALTNLILNPGDSLSVDLDGLSRYVSQSNAIIPDDIPLDVLYEDNWLIVINKQAGRTIHPSKLEETGTIANGLAHYYLQNGRDSSIHPISRLDRDTTGVILFAKDSYTADGLAKKLRAGNFIKEYLGVVSGELHPRSGVIDLPLSRDDKSFIYRAVRCGGKRARTYYATLHTGCGMSLLSLSPETGRTHQLRVHLSAMGRPILSDGLYGQKDKRLIARQALHSLRLTFTHPHTGDRLTVEGPPPPDFTGLTEYIVAGAARNDI